jgi:hypothetical protein
MSFAGLAFVVDWQPSSAHTCATRSWPGIASGSRQLASGHAGVDVSQRRETWRVALRNDSSHALGLAVSANARLVSLRSTPLLRSRLTRTRRAFSASLAGRSGTQRVSFSAPCASRISFGFTNAQVSLGSHRAPAHSFELRRPPVTGVAGRIIAGPTCPIVRPGCPQARAVPGVVEIRTAPATRNSPPGQAVKSVASDSHGRFATDLAPGTYLLIAEPKTPQPTGAATSIPVTVEVEQGVVSQVLLSFDTGIR